MQKFILFCFYFSNLWIMCCNILMNINWNWILFNPKNIIQKQSGSIFCCLNYISWTNTFKPFVIIAIAIPSIMKLCVCLHETIPIHFDYSKVVFETTVIFLLSHLQVPQLIACAWCIWIAITYFVLNHLFHFFLSTQKKEN